MLKEVRQIGRVVPNWSIGLFVVSVVSFLLILYLSLGTFIPFKPYDYVEFTSQPDTICVGDTNVLLDMKPKGLDEEDVFTSVTRISGEVEWYKTDESGRRVTFGETTIPPQSSLPTPESAGEWGIQYSIEVQGVALGLVHKEPQLLTGTQARVLLVNDCGD